MKKYMTSLALIFSGLLLFGQSFNSDYLSRGKDAYARGDWSGAVVSLKKAVSSSESTSTEAWYWLVMAEISSGDYSSAINDADIFLSSWSNDIRYGDVMYQKGRAAYLAGSYDTAIIVLGNFSNKFPKNEYVSHSLYWIGESLYAVGRFSESKAIFEKLISEYPLSVKKEAATYKIELIKQKNREEELLEILKWSHEESLKVIEEYQRREKNYEQTIAAYRKKNGETVSFSEIQKQNEELNAKLASLESINSELQAIVDGRYGSTSMSSVLQRLQDLKAKAVQIKTEERDSSNGVNKVSPSEKSNSSTKSVLDKKEE